MKIDELRRRLALYIRAAAATRSGNLAGLPLIPKSRNSPACRGGYNSFVLWIKQLRLPTATRVFDIGANHGDFSRAASACFPQASVWLFEPLPALWPRLERLAASRNGRWSVHQFALGATKDLLPLQASEQDNTIASFLGFSADYHRGNPAATATKSFPTRVEPLDDFCAQEGITSIDLMKIDVEGFEFDVLAGAGEMLQKTRALIIEVSLIRQTGGSDDALLRMMEILRASGFHVLDLIPSLFSREEPWRPLEYNLLARRSA